MQPKSGEHSYLLVAAPAVFEDSGIGFKHCETITSHDGETVLLFAVNCKDALEIPALFEKEDSQLKVAVERVNAAVKNEMLGADHMVSLLVPSHLAHGINEMLAEGKLIVELPEELSATLSPAFELAAKTPLQPGNHIYIKDGLKILG